MITPSAVNPIAPHMTSGLRPARSRAARTVRLRLIPRHPRQYQTQPTPVRDPGKNQTRTRKRRQKSPGRIHKNRQQRSHQCQPTHKNPRLTLNRNHFPLTTLHRQPGCLPRLHPPFNHFQRSHTRLIQTLRRLRRPRPPQTHQKNILTTRLGTHTLRIQPIQWMQNRTRRMKRLKFSRTPHIQNHSPLHIPNRYRFYFFAHLDHYIAIR